jgi:P27 family predicted phage terminase small subunit
MGARGPQPKNSQIKRLEGNPGRRPLKSGVKASDRPICPDHLPEYARACWDRIVASMPPAVYAAADQDLLAAYCIAADTLRQAVIALKTEPAVVEGANGAPYQNPWISIQSKQSQLLASLGARLGLDPAARESLSAPADDGPQSKFGDLIPIKGGKATAA